MKNKKMWFFLSLGCLLAGGFFSLAGVLLGGIPGFYLDQYGIHTAGEAAAQKTNAFQDAAELDAFDSMELDISYTENVELIASDRYFIEYRTTGDSGKPICQIENGKLLFREDPARYKQFRIWFLYADPGVEYSPEPGPYYVKIEYPADQIFADVLIRMEYGDLKLPHLQADTLDIRSEYGDVTLDGCTGSSLDIHMSGGNLSLGSVEAEQTEIHNEYGDILIDEAAGDSLNVDLDFGSFLTGSLDIQTLKVKDEYGTVSIRLPEDLSKYGYRLETEYGSILLNGKNLMNHDEEESEDECYYTSAGSNGRTVEISCENGEIMIDPAP